MNDLDKIAKEKLKNEIKKGSKPYDERSICCIQETDEKKIIKKTSRSQINLVDFIPNAEKPITFICVNLHIFQDSSGQKNYNITHKKEFKAIFDWINGYYKNSYTPNYAGICSTKPILEQQIDSRIRFILNRIEFYQDDALCNQGAWNYLPLVNAMLQRDSSMDNQLNIFLTDPDTSQPAAGYTQFPSSNMYFKQYIHSFRNRANPVPPFFLSQHWAHELGHVLGLSHTYSGGGASPICDETDTFFLYDVHGCGSSKTCPLPQSTGNNNNLMGGKESWSISTLQVARMQYCLQNLSVSKYANGICCPKCVAFGASIFRHKSQGSGTILEYEKTLANESWAWDGKTFTCPVNGVYHFGVSFQKDSLIEGGTSKDVWLKLWADSDLIGTAWSEQADARTGGIANAPQAGRRDSVCFTTNIKLKKGTVIKTEVGSSNNEKRHLVDINFNGHLLCSDCS